MVFIWTYLQLSAGYLQTSEHLGCNFYFPFNMLHHSTLCCKAQQRLSGSLLLLLLQGHFISVNDAPQNRPVFINGLGEAKARFSSHWLCDQLLHDILIFQSSKFRVGIVPWWDIFSRLYRDTWCFLLLTYSCCLHPSNLCYSISVSLSPSSTVITLYLPFLIQQFKTIQIMLLTSESNQRNT